MDSGLDLVRIDEGMRAKIVCRDCGRETYVSIMVDGRPTPIETVIRELADTSNGHRC